MRTLPSPLKVEVIVGITGGLTVMHIFIPEYGVKSAYSIGVSSIFLFWLLFKQFNQKLFQPKKEGE